MDIRVQANPFSPGQELDRFTAAQEGAGAVVSFTGVVRNDGGALRQMEIEHYPGMTEKALKGIAEDAARRWDLTGQLILHRHGLLRPGETIMMVATASRHRAQAFEAAEFLMDFLKSRAPFWKREVTDKGGQWVDAREIDEAALNRWQ